MKLVQKLPKRVQAYCLLAIAVLIWGAALPIVKPALSITTPVRFLFYRFTMASLFSLPFIIANWPKKKAQKKIIPKVIFSEFIGVVVALSLLYTGLSHSSAIETGLIATTMPIFVILLGVFFLREREETHEWEGALMALSGSILLAVLPIWSGKSLLGNFSLFGNVLVLGHNLAYSAYLILAKKHYKKLSKIFTASIGFWVGMIGFFIIGIMEAGSLSNLLFFTKIEFLNPIVLFPTLYMAIFGSLIALTFYLKGQDLIEVSEATIFWYLQPLANIPLAMLILGESISLSQIGAIAIVLIGIIWAEKR